MKSRRKRGFLAFIGDVAWSIATAIAEAFGKADDIRYSGNKRGVVTKDPPPDTPPAPRPRYPVDELAARRRKKPKTP